MLKAAERLNVRNVISALCFLLHVFYVSDLNHNKTSLEPSNDTGSAVILSFTIKGQHPF